MKQLLYTLLVCLTFMSCKSNQAPTAADDAATTDAGISITVDVLANDKDEVEGLNNSSLKMTAEPANGTIKIWNGKARYTPKAGFTGTDEATYEVCDKHESKPACATAKISFTVEAMKKVKISTEMGDMIAVLYNRTPQHRDNFLKLAGEGFFNDLLFHRVINNFMIQGGDPQSKGAEAGKPLGAGGPGYTVPAEFDFPDLFHKKGALSAARQGDSANPQKTSSGSQFYVVQGKKAMPQELQQLEQRLNTKFTPEQIETYRTTGGTPFLDSNYTVFGEVIEGLDVIDKIATVKTAPGDRPVEDVKMTVTVVE
ncbi:MAG: peptidylprolyl isomerase [Chitinophagales bacterium]